MSRCPCGSGKLYRDCCQPFHQQQSMAETAEQLMRSRYCAFAKQEYDYLKKTWHEDYCPEQVENSQVVHWLGLEILATDKGQVEDEHGMVHFKAYYKEKGKLQVLEERSQFLRLEGQWLYLKGETQNYSSKISRNAPCICGSGKKYKKCCG